MPRWPLAVGLLLLLLPGAAPAQTATTSPPVEGARPLPHPVVPPAGFLRAVERGTRTLTGAPGPRYWQQWTDYRLRARLDVEAKRLSGSGRITYHNRSPDALPVLYLHLRPNASAPGALRNDWTEVVPPLEIHRLEVGGAPLAVGTGYHVQGTILQVRLPRPLAPGDSVRLDAEWSFPVPREAFERAGWSRDDLFFLAYWYPQMAVYDDVGGWHVDLYRGLAEFYMGFGSYAVTVDAPEGWVVSATGALVNEAEVLPEPVRARLRKARRSDRVVHVLTAADLAAGRATRDVPGDRLQWRFRADSVRDFSFGATRESRWDAVRASVGDRDGDGRPEHTLVHSLWRASAPRWTQTAEYARHAVEFFSRFTGLPYPWPHLTAVEAEGIIGGGMEYPMITIIGAYTHAGDQALYDVTAHEVAHMWVPMIVGTDEKRHGWLDEGTTSFNEGMAAQARTPGAGTPGAGELRSYRALARRGGEGEVMRWSDFHYTTAAFGVASYSKPAALLFALRELLGEETFRRGYHDFLRSWAYRHPTPHDFFHAFEQAAGRDLDWFWHPWYFTTWTLDHAVGEVAAGPEGTRVTVLDLGLAPMPARLRATRQGGEVVEREVPVEHWLSGARAATVILPPGAPVLRVEIDPSGAFPDVDRSNDVWSR